MSMSQKNTIYHACLFFTESHERYYLHGRKRKEVHYRCIFSHGILERYGIHKKVKGKKGSLSWMCFTHGVPWKLLCTIVYVGKFFKNKNHGCFFSSGDLREILCLLSGK